MFDGCRMAGGDLVTVPAGYLCSCHAAVTVLGHDAGRCAPVADDTFIRASRERIHLFELDPFTASANGHHDEGCAENDDHDQQSNDQQASRTKTTARFVFSHEHPPQKPEKQGQKRDCFPSTSQGSIFVNFITMEIRIPASRAVRGTKNAAEDGG
jgi:hypothetical protein